MNSRQRLIKTINHEQRDRVVVDLGSTAVSGISAKALKNLASCLGLGDKIIKVDEPFQILGMIEEEMRVKLNIDIVGISSPYTMFGYKNSDWKNWKLSDGTDVLIGGGFETSINENGDTFVFPKGDLAARPSAKMPKGGFYFDNIVRQEEIDEDMLNARSDFSEDFKILSDEVLEHYRKTVDAYYHNTEYGLVLGSFFCSLGDFAPLPGPAVKEPKGIRKPEEWLISHYTVPEYVKDVYAFQTEVAIKNLELLKQAVGDKVQAVLISGTDFGTQRSEFLSPDLFREFYKPYFSKINAWVHKNTGWKTFYHSCGSIVNLLDDFVEMGVDILNPVQCSANGMDPAFLKEKYGKRLVFWGGGIDTQKTLPFGTAEEVKKEVFERINIFNKDGGFVFNSIHNIQAPTPVENILAMFNSLSEYNNINNK